MVNLAQMVEQGTLDPLLLLATALLLGALHALEPGHSKTMMVAFIVAVRGTFAQAVLLGGSAALSHTIIVWVLALLALTYGQDLIAAEMEPWFLLVSGVIVLGIALWMALGLRRSRGGGHAQGRHAHRDHHPGNTYGHDGAGRHPVLSADAHARAHAAEIEKRFASGRASTGQVIWFGVTGGLIPCPAAVTILILCLHLQHFWLGVGIVGSFSVGLALTLIAVGLLAAWGVAVARQRSQRFEALFAAAPYLSALLVGLIGVAMLVSGYLHLGSPVHH